MTRTLLRGLAWDIGLPVATYYALHLWGTSDWVALLASTVVSGLRLIVGAIHRRALNPFALVMLMVFGISLLLTFVSGNLQFLLVKESFVTGGVGLAFLVSVSGKHRPLTLTALQSWQPEQAAELGTRYESNPDIRHRHRLVSTVWGVGLLTEACLRVPLVFLLPPSVMVGLSTAMAVAAFGGLAVWSGRFAARGDAGGEDAATAEAHRG